MIRAGVFYSTFTWKHWAALILTSAAYIIPYKQLAQMAKPSYSDDGELLDGGFDMSTGGICGCVFLSLPSLFSIKADLRILHVIYISFLGEFFQLVR